MEVVATGRADILLVEDDPDDLALALRVFRKHDLADRVAVVRDGAEALDYLLRRGVYAHFSPDEKPRLVLLDLDLPRLHGIEVLKRMRKEESTRYIPVVVLSSSSDVGDLVDCYRNGTNSYVVKPVASAEFESTVASLGSYWLGLNLAPES